MALFRERKEKNTQLHNPHAAIVCFAGFVLLLLLLLGVMRMMRQPPGACRPRWTMFGA